MTRFFYQAKSLTVTVSSFCCFLLNDLFFQFSEQLSTVHLMLIRS